MALTNPSHRDGAVAGSIHRIATVEGELAMSYLRVIALTAAAAFAAIAIYISMVDSPRVFFSMRAPR